jgi:hypothetical protein
MALEYFNETPSTSYLWPTRSLNTLLDDDLLGMTFNWCNPNLPIFRPRPPFLRVSKVLGFSRSPDHPITAIIRCICPHPV